MLYIKKLCQNLICEVVSRIQMDILTGLYEKISDPSRFKKQYILLPFSQGRQYTFKLFVCLFVCLFNGRSPTFLLA
jgi:hypothetical protein